MRWSVLSVRPIEKGRVHFIIPCYRSGKTLEAGLQSILNLDYSQELIKVSVVENGTRDDQVADILIRYPQVSYYFIKQKSRSLARNYLVSQVSEELIAYLDADVVLDKEWLNHCLKAIDSRGMGVVEGPIYRVGDSFIDDIRRRVSELGCMDFNMLETRGGLPTLNAAAMLIKKNFLERIGLFDVGLRRYEDTDLTFRLYFSGIHMASVPQAKASVVISDSFFSYLFIRPLVMGYFQAKSLAKYPVIFPRPLRGLWITMRDIFKRMSLNDCLVDFFVIWIKFLLYIGSLIGRIIFFKQKKELQGKYHLLTKVLSWDGRVYCLNPLLGVCFQEGGVYLVDIRNGVAFFFTGTLSRFLRKIIYSSQIDEEDSKDVEYLSQRKILIESFKNETSQS